jgi:hypothetical protein
MTALDVELEEGAGEEAVLDDTDGGAVGGRWCSGRWGLTDVVGEWSSAAREGRAGLRLTPRLRIRFRIRRGQLDEMVSLLRKEVPIDNGEGNTVRSLRGSTAAKRHANEELEEGE